MTRQSTLALWIGALALAMAGCGGRGCSREPGGAAGGSGGVGAGGGEGGTIASGAGGTGAGAGGTIASGAGGTGAGGAAVAGTGGAGTGGTIAGGAIPTVGPCWIFSADNPWNRDVSGDPPKASGATYLANMVPGTALHPDWGTVTDEYGIPFTIGTGATPQPMRWTTTWGPDESDTLPCPSGGGDFCYPIPLTAPIEGGPSAPTRADRHLLYVDTAGAPDGCTLYELYNAQNPSGTGGFTAANGAIFHLGSNALRPDGWTSADAAGLPILPGLVRLDETMAGEIRHAIRFTMSSTSNGYIHPATHAAGSTDLSLPPMGLRLRLKAAFDTAPFSGPAVVIMTAMKKYGIILADNGSDWYFTGESNEGWAPYMGALLSAFGQVLGSDFEVVDTGPVSTNGL